MNYPVIACILEVSSIPDCYDLVLKDPDLWTIEDSKTIQRTIDHEITKHLDKQREVQHEVEEQGEKVPNETET